MIPETLSLKGFLSYKDRQVLDFTKFHVALISGENGHGKSSLLDGITFALFSMARGVEGTKKGISDLVTNGENSLSVRFQFVQDQKRYAISRTFDKVKSASNVFLEEEKDGQFVSISENTIRDTDSKIRDILKMDYDTFITTSFILQGKSDYFTTMNPSERIEVMKQMLFLNIYEKAKEITKDRMRLVDYEIKSAKKKNELLASEILEEDAIRKEFQSIKKEREDIECLLNDLKKSKKEIDERKIQKEKLISKKTEKESNLKKYIANRNQKGEKLRMMSEEIEKLEKLIDRQDEIIKQYEEYLKIKQMFEELLVKKAEYEKLMRAKEKILSQIESERRMLDESFNLKTGKVHELSEKNTVLQDEVRILTSEIDIRKEKIEELEKQQKENELKLGDIAKELTRTQERKEAKDRLLSEGSIIKERGLERKKALEEQLKENEKQLMEIQKSRMKIDINEIESKLQEKLVEYEHVKAEKEKQSALEERVKKEREILVLDRTSLDEKVRALNEKKDLLREGEGKCPLCGSPLDEAHRQEILKQIEVEQNEVLERLSTINNKLEKLEQELSSVKVVSQESIDLVIREVENLKFVLEQSKSEVENLKQKETEFSDRIAKLEESLGHIFSEDEALRLKEISVSIENIGNIEDSIEKLQEEIKDLEKMKENIRNSITEIAKEISVLESKIEGNNKSIDENSREILFLKREIAEIAEKISGKEYLKPFEEELRILEENIKSVGFKEETYSEISKQREALSKVENEFRTLQEAKIKIGGLEKTTSEVRGEIEDIDDAIFTEEKALKEIENELVEFANVEEECRKKEEEVAKTENLLKSKEQIFFSVSQKLLQIEEKKKEKEKNEQLIKDSEDKLKILNVCDTMFGKEGIPIAIINSILPQIEAYSNELLSAMSGGTMKLKFNTIRETKTGEKTTLEINVYDNGERRRYELFSGGEQFRINLAIRIGISMFLSSIANSPLEMLVIDEGFGSQDETGKERILSEINAIKNLFKKVVVITHMGDIKESFTYEIRVVKDSRGSRLYVV